MYPAHKNSYLQSTTPIDPRIINRSVDKARDIATVDQFDANPAFNRLTSEQPCIPIENCDVTRRPLAFGRWAMPKLRRELHSKDPDVVMQAITSVCDIVHDPERNYEAIKLRFPDRMVDMLEHIDPAIRERVCIALTTIANLLDGKMAIVRNKNMIKNIVKVLHDSQPEVQLKAITLVETLGTSWMVADVLVDNGFVEILVEKIKNYVPLDPCLPLYMKALENLLYCNGKYIALECDLYLTLINILEQEEAPEIIGPALKLISILTQTPEGKEIALQVKLLKKLYIYIHDDREEIYRNAAAALLFATIKTEAIIKAIKLPNLTDRLLVLAKNHHDLSTQKYCLQIITNLCGHSRVKKEFVETRFEEIQQIYVSHDEHAERIKHILLFDVLKY